MPTFDIRDALATDCAAATDLCLRSKAVWGYDEQFMRQCRDALAVTPERLQTWRVRVAEGPRRELLGIAAASVDNTARDRAELELLFVEPSAMGAGIGGALLADTLAILRGQAVATLWILSDPGAEPFYVGQGAVREGLRPSDAIAGRQLPWLRIAVGRSGPQAL